MSDLFDPHSNGFVGQVMVVSFTVLFFIGLIVNHCKTQRKIKRESESQTINPILDNV
jgi:hypothetical protein